MTRNDSTALNDASVPRSVTGPREMPRVSGPPVLSGASGHGLFRILWRRRLIMLLTILAAVSAAAVYLLLATPIYSSRCVLYVQQSGPRIMGGEDFVTRASTNFLNTECQLLRSGPILASALDAPGIRELRTFAGAESPIDLLARNLSVSPGKENDLITVSFESPYPEDTVRVVNAVADAYVAYQSGRQRNTAAEVLKILQKEKVKRDTEQNDALKAVVDFKQKHAELAMEGEKGNVITQRLERLSTALTEAEVQLAEAKAEYETVAAMKDDPAKILQYFEAKRLVGGVFVSVQDEDSRLRQELDGLGAQIQTLRREYAASHPAVKALEDRVADIQAQMAQKQKDLAANQLAAIQLKYEAVAQRHERLRAAYEQQLQVAQGLNRASAELLGLQNNLEQARKLAEIVENRIKELNVTEDTGALNISVLESGGKPNRPVKPVPMQVIAIALAMGIFGGVGLSLLRNSTDKRLVGPQEIAGLMGVPVLGTLPKVGGGNEDLELERSVLESPSSPVAEACRGIRTALKFGAQAAHDRVVLVTSAGQREGKSALVSNLAAAMAQAGQRTLVVDADFHQPRQQAIFRLADGPGLAQVLAGESDWGAVVRREVIPGLDVLTSGPRPSNPAELLNGRALPHLMRELAGAYDAVLVDSPPVMLATDGLVLAAVCDATLLVLRVGQSDRRATEQAQERLLSVGGRIVGVVVNGFRRDGQYQYYSAPYGDQNEPREEAARS